MVFVFRKVLPNGRLSKNFFGRFNVRGILRDYDLGVSSRSSARREWLSINRFLVIDDSLPVVSIDDAFSDYSDNGLVLGLSPAYLHNLKSYINRVQSDLHWLNLSDVNLTDFERWRSSSSLSKKTLNNYLLGWSSFFAWCFKRSLISCNCFENCDPIKLHGVQVRPRRALTDVEVQRLLSRSPADRALVYRFALYTGLRRSEVFGLCWSDLSLSGSLFVRVPARVAKNRRDSVLPLRDDLAALLQASRGSAAADVPVFRRLWRQVRQDFDLACIPSCDSSGYRCDFHSLRKTFCTLLARSGVFPRVAMELMRHSDYRLTGSVYTDSSLLDLRSAVAALPEFN